MAKQRRHISIDVEEYITTWALRGKTPAAIHEGLEKESRFSGRVPTLRTVQTRVRAIRPLDASGTWSFLDAEPEEARIVLPIMAAVMLEDEGQKITRGDADIIVRIAIARPDLVEHNPLEVVYLARLYRSRMVNKEPTADLDAYLAFGPWRGDDAYTAWRHAIDNGWIADAVRTADLLDELSDALASLTELGERFFRSRITPEEAERHRRRVRFNPEPGVLLSIEMEEATDE